MDITESRSNGRMQDWQPERNAWREDERREAAPLGIGFDGRYYRYRQYRYDRCSDAVNYARLDSTKPAYRSKITNALPWTALEEPTDTERQSMAELGVTFDGKYYRYESYRYDNLGDAIGYAGLNR